MTSERWVHLVTAPDQYSAELWVSILRDEGIGAMVRPSDAVSFMGMSGLGTRIQVFESDLQRARELLDDIVEHWDDEP